MGLIIDNFAGGGGASTGIEAALGRPIDIAINHDPEAVAMHRVNHPDTLHLCQSVWLAEPAEVCRGRPVDFAWFSPDCKHFSKAKGGKPVEKNIRDLAWVVVKWAQLPPELRPKVFMLENVEEFRTWGPLTDAGLPCPDRQGETFNLWKGALEQQDYQVEFRELRACDYGGKMLGSPATIRKRLYGIGRCDGLPIVWPEPTHGAPDDPDVIAGRKQPWRVAADILDFTLPCPSIFETSEEIFRTLGLRTKRPLAEATLRRIARGVVRYVLDAPRPFIVGVGGRMGQTMERGVEQPMNTGTAKEDAALIMPFVSYAQQGGANRAADAPLHTITASPKDQNCVVAPTLIQTGYGEREGQAPRSLDIGKPVGTVVSGGKHAVVAAFLAQHNTGATGHSAEEPVSTLTAKPGPQGVVSAHLMMMRNSQKPWSAGDEPMHTITAGGAYPNLVATHLQTMRGSNRRDQATDAPLRTISAGGNHSAVIAAFLAKYYGAGDPSQSAEDPLHTLTTKPRHGLVTVQIDGDTYAISDIGMRMLTPRERFRAQGFPESYIIDHGIDEAGQRMPLTLDAQGRMCGNSVCPPLAEALVRANMAEAEATLEAA
ncbi:MAG TPA: DNA cytosine methyltransferase [Brevundimonas sp.]|nr:DNA cytosine methyltransferase [Brevundimonas sp.]